MKLSIFVSFKVQIESVQILKIRVLKKSNSWTLHNILKQDMRCREEYELLLAHPVFPENILKHLEAII